MPVHEDLRIGSWGWVQAVRMGVCVSAGTDLNPGLALPVTFPCVRAKVMPVKQLSTEQPFVPWGFPLSPSSPALSEHSHLGVF